MQMQVISMISFKGDHKHVIYLPTIISWRSVKQILVATLSNHSEIIAIHEVSWECICLM